MFEVTCQESESLHVTWQVSGQVSPDAGGTLKAIRSDPGLEGGRQGLDPGLRRKPSMSHCVFYLAGSQLGILN